MPQTLNRPARSAIVLIALLQGLMLYAAQVWADSALFDDPRWCYGWYAWVLTVPSAVALSLTDLRQRRLWLDAGLASLLVLAMAGWIGWNLTGETGLFTSPLVTPLGLGLAVAVFVALPWWQFRLHHGHWRASYPALFQHAWQNGLTLALAALFTGLTWLLLHLWAALFDLLDVRWFSELFRQDAFVALATGVFVGFGVLIGRTQQRAIQITRDILFAVCKLLLPLLALIAVLFVLSLPLTGLEPLWRTGSAGSLLLSIALLLIGFVNAVYQRGADTPPYPIALRRLVEASLLALPVFAALTLYALGLRVLQHGWTIDRVWALLVSLAVTGYALGYGWAALRRGEPWLRRLEPVNRVMCWAVLALALLGNSPLLDPVRISLSSQLGRLRAAPAQLDTDDAKLLRFELGRRGVQALRELQREPTLAADARIVSVLTQSLASSSYWNNGIQIDDGIRDLAVLRRQLRLAKGSSSPPDDWWQALVNRTVPADDCLKRDKRCVVLSRDLDGDHHDEVLLCDVESRMGTHCLLHARDKVLWQPAGTIRFDEEHHAPGRCHTCEALLQGRLNIQPARWPMLSVSGRTAVVIAPSPSEPNQGAP